MGTITISFDWYNSHRVKAMLQRDMQRKWKESIFMAERGHGKNYWADYIDWDADLLMQIMEQESN